MEHCEVRRIENNQLTTVCCMNYEPQLINQRLLIFKGIIISGKLAVKGIYIKHIKLGQNLESQFLWNGATFQQIR